MDADRRRLRRAPTRLMALIKTVSTGQVRRVLTKDISGGGISFMTDETLSPGTPLEVEMTLPGHASPIRCMAEVVWLRSAKDLKHMYESPSVETGVQFVSIAPQDQKLLTQYGMLNAPPV